MDEIKIVDDILDSFLIASLQLALVREPALYRHLILTDIDYLDLILSLVPQSLKPQVQPHYDLKMVVFSSGNLLGLDPKELDMLRRMKNDLIFKTMLLDIVAEKHKFHFAYIMLGFISKEPIFNRHAVNVIANGSDHLIEIILRDLLEYHPEDCYLLFPDIPQDENFASRAYFRILRDKEKFAHQFMEWFKAKRQLRRH